MRTSVMLDEASAKRLASAVHRRRVSLGMEQKDIPTAGGPGLTVYRDIERARTVRGLTTKTVIGLERALRWGAGSVEAILDGEAPFLTEEEEDDELTIRLRVDPAYDLSGSELLAVQARMEAELKVALMRVVEERGVPVKREPVGRRRA